LPVTLQAKCIGSLALKALAAENASVAGQVVNIFSNSFYMKTGNGELIFFTNRPLRSPITVNLDATSDLEHLVKPLEPLNARGKEIRIGTDIIIELSTASVYQDRIRLANEPRSVFTRIGTSLRIVSFVLGIIDTGQSVLDPHSLAHSGIVEFVSDGVILLRHRGTERRFRDAALRIVGLGSGFTPSGDDTLGGFLATYNSFAKTIERAPVLLDSELLKEKTSWTSAKLLDYMQRLILDEQLRLLIDSATNGDQDALVIVLETLLPRGHTSGIDIAVGVVLALSLIRDIVLKKEETEIIARTLGLGNLA
jgi:hypothetical protein